MITVLLLAMLAQASGAPPAGGATVPGEVTQHVYGPAACSVLMRFGLACQPLAPASLSAVVK